MSTPSSPPGPPQPVPAEVRTAVISAYYQRVVASSDGARQRAQAAYGIAGAIAAGVIAAGLLNSAGKQSQTVQMVALSALVVWLVAAALFLRSVSAPFADDLTQTKGVDAFVNAALTAVRAERQAIDKWQARAQRASLVAAVVTVVAFALALAEANDEPRERAVLALSAKGQSATQAICGRALRQIRGAVNPDRLRDAMIQVEADAGVCGTKQTTLTLPSTAIAAMRR